MDEKELIQALSEGRQWAFEKMFGMYYARLVVFALRFVSDDDTARELVQDVFVSFYEKHTTINIHTSLKSHLYQSVRNRCLNHLKREKLLQIHHNNLQVQMADQAFYNSAVEENELENRLFELVGKLPDKCRMVFEMSRVEGLRNDDIASKLDISKRTVETQISKALKFLRENLDGLIGMVLVTIDLCGKMF